MSAGLSRLSFYHRLALYAAPAAAVVLAWYAVPLLVERIVAPEARPVAAEPEPDGARLFSQNCAYCHGERGDGRGVAALNPPARYFGAEQFRLACTTNKFPCDDDLLRIIRSGIPGSAMPSFDHLTEPQQRAIIGHIRVLTKRGMYDKEWKRIYDAGDDPDPVAVSKKVDNMTVPGDPLPIPPIPPPSAESIAKGRILFSSPTAGCSKCHGEKGLGDGPQITDPKFVNDNGTRARPRDLTVGVFKGGREAERLYARIWNGIPGTPMPEGKVALKPDEVIQLIHFILSLAPPPPAVPDPGRPIISANR